MICVGLAIVMWCQLPPAPAVQGATFCQVAKPIYWSAADTRATKQDADRHNRIGRRLCGWGRP